MQLEENSLAILEKYNNVLKTTNNDPNEDISGIFNSIRNHWSEAEALNPAEIKSQRNLTESCMKEVKNLVTLPRENVPQAVPLAAAVAVYTSINTLIDLTKEAVVMLGLGIDNHIREQKIKKYVLSSKDTVETALGNLNTPDRDIGQLCQNIGFEPPCPSEGTTITRWDGVTIARKWAALRKPWHLFLSMSATKNGFMLTLQQLREAYENSKRSAIANNQPIPPEPILNYSPYWYLIDKQQEELDTALTDYLTLRNSPNAGLIGKAISSANITLLKLANDEISASQAWGIFKDMAGQIKKISEKGEKGKKESESIKENIEKMLGD